MLPALFSVLAALTVPADARPAKRSPVTVDLTHFSLPPVSFSNLAASASSSGLDGYKFNQNYALTFGIGTPAQEVTLLLDTGSADVTIFGEGCDSCGDIVWNYTKSSTYKPTGKNLTLYYGTGAATGIVATDTLQIGGFTQTGVEVVNVQSGPLKEYLADGEIGLLGMGYPWPYGTDKSWAKDAATSLWPEPRFSLYLGQPGTVSSTGPSVTPNAGQITFGGVDESRISGKPVGTYPVVTGSPQRWNIEMGGCRINGEEIVLPAAKAKTTLIDCGAENMAVPIEVCQAISAKIPGSSVEGSTIRLPCNATEAVEFKFGDYWFPQAARDLFFLPELVHPSPGMCNSAFLCSASQNNGYTYQMGAAFMRNVYTTYSYQPMQISFTPLQEPRGPWPYGWTGGSGTSSSSSVSQSMTSSTSASATMSSTSESATVSSTSQSATMSSTSESMSMSSTSQSMSMSESQSQTASSSMSTSGSMSPSASETSASASSTSQSASMTSASQSMSMSESQSQSASSSMSTGGSMSQSASETSASASSTSQSASMTSASQSMSMSESQSQSASSSMSTSASMSMSMSMSTPSSSASMTASSSSMSTPSASASMSTPSSSVGTPTSSPCETSQTPSGSASASLSRPPCPSCSGPTPTPTATKTTPPPWWHTTSRHPTPPWWATTKTRPPPWWQTSAPPPTQTGIPPPNKPCPCHAGDKNWYWDGSHWRWSWWIRNRGWRWGRWGFGCYSKGSDYVEQWGTWWQHRNQYNH